MKRVPVRRLTTVKVEFPAKQKFLMAVCGIGWAVVSMLCNLQCADSISIKNKSPSNYVFVFFYFELDTRRSLCYTCRMPKTNNQATRWSVDITVPDGARRRCVVTAQGGPSRTTAEKVACENLQYYTVDPTGPQYAEATAYLTELCEVCDIGGGLRRRRTSRFYLDSLVRCTNCKPIKVLGVGWMHKIR